MQRITIILMLVSAYGCGETCEQEGNYTATYREAGGTCGPRDREAVRLRDGYSFGQYNDDGYIRGFVCDDIEDWPDGECTFSGASTCRTGADESTEVSIDLEPDGEGYKGTAEFTIKSRSTGDVFCTGTYEVSVKKISASDRT